MQTSQDNSKSKNKTEKNEKKMSFSVVEAIERTTDSIERLASLINKKDTKLDRRDDQYRPRIYQGRNRGCSYRQNTYRSRNRYYSREWYQNNYRGRGNYIDVVIETTYPITGIVVGPKTGTNTEMGIGTMIDQIIEEMIVSKGMEIEIRTAVGLEKGIEIGVVQEKVPNPELDIYLGIKVEMKIGDKVEIILETDLNQGQDEIPM